MLKLKKYFFIFIILFIIFPLITNAATELGASTQSPVVGSTFYVQLDATYGDKLNIRDFHVIIDYDTSYLELSEVLWLQYHGDYRENNGRIYIDKEEGIDWTSGAVVQFKFKVLKDGLTRVNVSRNGDSHYTNGDVIGQSFAPVSISAVKPNSSTIIKSLYVKDYIMTPTFEKTTYQYNVKVPSDVTHVEVVAEKGDPKQTITGIGRKTLNYGDNRVRVVVTAEDGSSRTYEVMIHRIDDRTGDTSLKSVTATNTNLHFVEGQTTYETTVSRSVDTTLINAVTTDPKATLTGTGTKNLNIGINTFYLVVTSSGGKSTTYTIIINRSAEELEAVKESSKLLSIKVNNLGLDLSNNTTKWLYGVTSEYDSLNIDTITESPTATINIVGNEKLNYGINVIKITVTETKGEDITSDENKNKKYDSTEYSIIVFKNVQNANVINNLNEIKNNNNYIYNTTTTDSNVVPSSSLNVLKTYNKSLYYNVVNIYNGLLYQAVISNNLPDTDLDVSFKKLPDKQNTYETLLPKDTEITLYVGEDFQDNSAIKIYTYNESNQYNLLTSGIKVQNGYVKFTTNGEKYYVLTYASLIKEESLIEKIFNKYKKFLIMIVIALLAIALIIYIISKNKSKKVNNNEPLY